MRHLLREDSDGDVHEFIAEDSEPPTAAAPIKLNGDLGGADDTLFVE